MCIPRSKGRARAASRAHPWTVVAKSEATSGTGSPFVNCHRYHVAFNLQVDFNRDALVLALSLLAKRVVPRGGRALR